MIANGESKLLSFSLQWTIEGFTIIIFILKKSRLVEDVMFYPRNEVMAFPKIETKFLHTSISSYQVVIIHKHLNLIQHWRVLPTTLQIFSVNLREWDSLLKTLHAPNVQCRTFFKSSFKFISLFRVLHKSGNGHSWLALTNSFLEDDWFPLWCWFSKYFYKH